MVSCAALNCQNATSGAHKNSSVTFYGFPLQNQALLKRWIHNMGRAMENPSKHQRLCSEHFEESSFHSDPLGTRKIRRLLKEAVPSKFILGQDGHWLVGTPQGFCDLIRNKTRKQMRIPDYWRVSGKFPNGAEGPTLDDWQNEFYKMILKENCASLATLGKGYPIPKSKILAGKAAQVKDQQDLEERKVPASLGTGHGGATIRSQLQSGGGTQVHGSSSGGSRNLRWNLSNKGETSERAQTSTNQANPVGKGGSSSFPAAGQPEESQQFLLQQQSRRQLPEVPWFICTDCGKSFARHGFLLRHRKTHMGERSHSCPECGKRFLERSGLTNHLRIHLQIIHVPNALLG